MSEEQEPSIEEILNSIRQIITDDDDDDSAPKKEPEEEVASEPEEEPVAESAAEPEGGMDEIEEITGAAESELEPESKATEEDILELTEIVEDSPGADDFEIDLLDAEEEPEIEEIQPEPAPVPAAPLEPVESILSDKATDATLEGFARLATNIALTRSGQGVTLEDIVKDMLRPMLHEWLDAHLPALIERLVQEELEKISRKAMDE